MGAVVGVGMKPEAAQALLRWAEEVIKTYNPVTSSVDTHAHEMLGDTEHEVRQRPQSPPAPAALTGRPACPQDADPDAVFVQQVFYGCVRYKKFLKVRGLSEPSGPIAATLTCPHPRPCRAPWAA